MFGSGDAEAALPNSAVYLEAFGHIVVAWIWLQQVLAADGRTGDFYDGKRQAARYPSGTNCRRRRPNSIFSKVWTDHTGNARRMVLTAREAGSHGPYAYNT